MNLHAIVHAFRLRQRWRRNRHYLSGGLWIFPRKTRDVLKVNREASARLKALSDSVVIRSCKRGKA